MQLHRRDLAYLFDIYENCKDILEYTQNMKFYHFENDRRSRKAVERSFEIIGQASNKMSREAKDFLSQIPWGQIVAFRNVLAHEYDEILTSKIYHITKHSIPD